MRANCRCSRVRGLAHFVGTSRFNSSNQCNVTTSFGVSAVVAFAPARQKRVAE
jgi:hypothetical protein